MSKRVSGFIAGMLTTILISSLSVGVLAATGQLIITVDPINIQVNGQTFQPKDAQGKDVPVFSYNGTTYAPLRALAETYGLEVGYDAANNMATVKNPESESSTIPPQESQAPQETTAAYYTLDGCPVKVPDFGTMFGVPCNKTIILTKDAITYRYLLSDIQAKGNVDIYMYTNALVAEGYTLIGTLEDGAIIYLNGDVKVFFASRADQGYFELNVLWGNLEFSTT